MKRIKYFKTLLCSSALLIVLPCFVHDNSKADTTPVINTIKHPIDERGVFVIDINKGTIDSKDSVGINNTNYFIFKDYLKHNDLDLIERHKGSEQLDHDKFERTVNYVLNNIQNLNEFKNKSGLKKLVIETAIVETHLGKSNYSKSARVNNYGLIQLRWQTAKEVMEKLKKTNIESYASLMKLYDRGLNLQENLLQNVPFSIGICAEYYLARNKNLHKNLASTHARARQWKKFYNTRLGVGSVNGYMNRVKDFYASL